MQDHDAATPTAVSAEGPGQRFLRRNKTILSVCTGLLALVCFVVFVWPTRHRSEPPLYFFQGDRKIRSDRFTGALQMKFDNGWENIEIKRLDRTRAIVRFAGSEFTIQLDEERNNWLDEVHVP
jgi:hypothetical protein